MPEEQSLPNITLLVTAFNEKNVVDQKIRNSHELIYPKNKLTLLWVTDGSDDGTPEKVKAYPDVKVLHEKARKGKIHAMNRAATQVTTDIIVFCDANTLLTKDTLMQIAKHFQDERVGCVAGEKQIIKKDQTAAGSGEGLYWKYESWLKKLDYRFNTTLGAAGELFAVRKELFIPVESDTVLDDFIISLRIAAQKYVVAYEPQAIAREYPSYSVAEEMKRKIRIAAGGFQSLMRLLFLLNPIKHPRLAFQFISHKVFRWLICPISMVLLIPAHMLVAFQNQDQPIYTYLLIIHLALYILAFAGWQLEKQNIKSTWIYLPYYFISTNLAQLKGLVRYIKKSQSVNWERARRAN
jgi:cellulose synthase/poly-beta-1,6-N-acetylglucosamine synthase-like glycosyltransferase